MKRRIKFFTSVASLTLAMFLAMTGVWAAASRQVAISGTLTFSSSNVSATIKVYQSTASTFTLPSTDVEQVGTDLEFSITGNQDGRDVTLSPALNDTTTKYTFIVMVQGGFPAGSSSKIDIDLTAPTVPSGGAGWLTLTHSGNATAPTAPVASGTTAADRTINGNAAYYYTFTYTADPTKAPQSSGALSFTCNVTLSRINAAAQ
jgi:hypothetical protein